MTDIEKYKEAIRSHKKWHIVIRLQLNNGSTMAIDRYVSRYESLPNSLLNSFAKGELINAKSVQYAQIRTMRAVHEEIYGPARRHLYLIAAS